MGMPRRKKQGGGKNQNGLKNCILVSAKGQGKWQPVGCTAT